MGTAEKMVDRFEEWYTEMLSVDPVQRGQIVVRMQRMYGMGKIISRPERIFALQLWISAMLAEAAVASEKPESVAKRYVFERLLISHQGLRGKSMEQMVEESNRLATKFRETREETIEALLSQCAILLIMLVQEDNDATERRPNPSTG